MSQKERRLDVRKPEVQYSAFVVDGHDASTAGESHIGFDVKNDPNDQANDVIKIFGQPAQVICGRDIRNDPLLQKQLPYGVFWYDRPVRRK